MVEKSERMVSMVASKGLEKTHRFRTGGEGNRGRGVGSEKIRKKNKQMKERRKNLATWWFLARR